MEGERFPQKPIGNYSPEAESAFDDLEVSIEELEDTPEMKQIAGYLESLNETALKNILLQELRKSGGTVQTIARIARYIPKSEVTIEEGNETDDYLGTYSDNSIKLNAHKLAQSSTMKARVLHLEQRLVPAQDSNNYNQIVNAWFRSKREQEPQGFTDQMIAKFNNISEPAPFTSSELLAIHSTEHNLIQNEKEITAHLAEVVCWITTIHTLIHEQLHALTDKGELHEESTTDRELGFEIKGRGNSAVGFQEYNYDYHRVYDLQTGEDTEKQERYLRGRGINEAVTELISLRLAQTYLTQCPRNGFERKYAADILRETQVSYTHEMRITEQYIALVSALSDIPEDVVLNGLWSAYLNNDAYLPDAFSELLTEHLPKIEGQDWQWLTESLRTQLSANEFPVDSSFYEVLADIIGLLPPETQEKVREKLTIINTKYFGDPEDNSEIIESEEKTE